MQVRLPEISKGSKEATITFWHVAENGKVTKNQDLVEVVTDKATFDIPSPVSGALKKIIKKEGESAKFGEIIAEIE